MRKEEEKRLDEYCKKEILMGCIAEAEELTGLAVLLASNTSSYITGQVFCQDSGQSAKI